MIETLSSLPIDTEIETFAKLSVKRLNDIALLASATLTVGDFEENGIAREVGQLVDDAKRLKQEQILSGQSEDPEFTFV